MLTLWGIDDTNLEVSRRNQVYDYINAMPLESREELALVFEGFDEDFTIPHESLEVTTWWQFLWRNFGWVTLIFFVVLSLLTALTVIFRNKARGRYIADWPPGKMYRLVTVIMVSILGPCFLVSYLRMRQRIRKDKNLS